jgi:hypothetical protein
VRAETRGRRGRLVLTITAAALLYLVPGVWLLASPESFFALVAPFHPYNAHFMRDAGAFSVGLGVALVLAAAGLRDSLVVVLIAVGTAFTLHGISHGVSDDPGTSAALFALAAAVWLAAGLQLRAVRRNARSS